MQDFPEAPEDILAMLKSLKPDKRQDFIEPKMDSGHVKRRPRSTPYTVLVGPVTVDDHSKGILEDFLASGPFLMPNPEGDGQWIVVHHRDPRPRSSQFKDTPPGVSSSRWSYEYEVVLHKIRAV